MGATVGRTWKFTSQIYLRFLEDKPHYSGQSDRWFNLYQDLESVTALSILGHARMHREPVVFAVEGEDAQECASAIEQVFAGGTPSVWSALLGVEYLVAGARRRGLS